MKTTMNKPVDKPNEWVVFKGLCEKCGAFLEFDYERIPGKQPHPGNCIACGKRLVLKRNETSEGAKP